jgi:ribose 5-phosphate isomerase B
MRNANKNTFRKNGMGAVFMIALGCDSAGFALMKEIKAHLGRKGLEYKDFGTFDENPVDYPLYAKVVAKAVLSGEADKGILVCGSGIGISIAANKFKGIRCALCHDVFSAKSTRDHNDSNVLALGGWVIGKGLALEIIDTWLNTPFSGEERHQRRIDLIDSQATGA